MIDNLQLATEITESLFELKPEIEKWYDRDLGCNSYRFIVKLHNDNDFEKLLELQLQWHQLLDDKIGTNCFSLLIIPFTENF